MPTNLLARLFFWALYIYQSLKYKGEIELLPIQILLAESDPAEIAKIRSITEQDFQAEFKIAKNFNELLERIAEEPPQLVILGNINRFDYFHICQECKKIWGGGEMQIALLSKQKFVDDYFDELLKNCFGVTDIIYDDLLKLKQLLRILTESADRPSTNELSLNLNITGEMMLSSLEEIVTITDNYFGTLAQGNYWRKARTRIVDEFPVDEFPYILNWSADHFSKFECDERILTEELTDEDIQSLGAWVREFIKECERTMIDFGIILNNNSSLSLLTRYLVSIAIEQGLASVKHRENTNPGRSNVPATVNHG